tara:strand:- start:379 stop:1560 length:1182 start_codon:yes stop_codon:yes gene_type:complete
MKWSSAISTRDSIGACIDEVIRATNEQLDGLESDLTIVFISPHFRSHYTKIPGMIRERLNPGILIGCSGDGIIGAGEEVEGDAAISMTRANLPEVSIKPFHIDAMELPDQDTGPRVWWEWLGVKADPTPHFILLADPFSFRAEEFLQGVDFAYPNSVKIGGLASGTHSGDGNIFYAGDRIHTSGAVGVALDGNIKVDTIVAQGCRPTGKLHKITKCHNAFLQALDGHPPFNVLEEMIANANDYDRKLIQSSLFLGIEMNPLGDEPKQGDFLIRNIIGLDRASGALSIGTLLREGQLVQFHLRDNITSAEDLSLLLSQYTEQDQSKKASGALLFSCLGRGKHLYGRANHDTDMFSSKLGGVPVGGFFCNGEIGPVGETTYLHGYTSSFGIFRAN